MSRPLRFVSSIISFFSPGKSLEDLTVPQYKHSLMLFGGLQGLEAALENDETFEAESIEEVN